MTRDSEHGAEGAPPGGRGHDDQHRPVGDPDVVGGSGVEDDSALDAESGETEDLDGLFPVLEEYVEALHELDTQKSGRLLTRHPEHQSLLKTLETLERLAPGGPGRDSDQLANARTIRSDSDVAPGPTAALPSEGPQFGRFELYEELGRGGMGVVYRARQLDLDRIVAIKMILTNRLASGDDVRRFKAEARTAAAIRHPNVVGIHEVGEHLGQSFFTMEYVSGPSLDALVESGPAPVEEAVRLVAKLARAVDHLHSQGIVHRDLKPSNVLLDDAGEPRLTDFGLAKVFQADNSNTQTGTIVGTASYMAPEQAAGRVHDISPRTDVYGLGALLYELLSGRPPFREDHPLDTLVQVLEGEPPPLRRLNPNVPAALETICRKCLEKSPDERYASAADLADDLERWLQHEPITAESGTLYQHARRWVRRQPALVSRLACVILAAAIIQTRFMFIGGTFSYHLMIMTTLAAWGGSHVLFQWLLQRPGTANVARYGWVTSDVLFETGMLWIADPAVGPLVVGYPLIVAASGLFFRVGLVLYTTILSVVCYAVFGFVVQDYGKWPHYGTIFAVILMIQGLIVAYQVHRVRMLSRYYGRSEVDIQ